MRRWYSVERRNCIERVKFHMIFENQEGPKTGRSSDANSKESPEYLCY